MNACMIGWFDGWRISWLTYHFINRSFNQSVDWMINQQIDWQIDQECESKETLIVISDGIVFLSICHTHPPTHTYAHTHTHTHKYMHRCSERGRWTLFTVFAKFQIHLLSNRVKPIFSNLIEQDSGMVTAGNVLGNQGNGSREEKTDLYKRVYNVAEVKTLMEHGVEEYNKTHPRIKLALYRVSN